MENRVTQKSCRQCGTCCEKGGPALHQEDLPLVQKGVIPLNHLCTLRAGEMARDNVRGTLEPVPTDVIKIKGKNSSRACRYLDESQTLCTIYDHRPAECRTLQCWNTRAIEALYSKNRLDRKTILQNRPDFWDLAKEHQARCDYGQLKQLIGKLESVQKKAALKQLSEIIHYDRHIRTLLVEKTGLNPDICDFLFGRPLTTTLPGYDLNIKKNHAGKWVIALV